MKIRTRGFTLIELVIYTGIFAVAGTLLTGILLTVTQTGEREQASSEVTSQLNFVNQTISRLVRDSSNIDIPISSPTSNLKLLMKDSSKDPTLIYLSGTNIVVKEGTNPETVLTNEKVIINSLNFVRTSMYTGHDIVSVDISMTYNSENPKNQITRTLESAIGRVSAATFDSNLIPAAGTLSLGQNGSVWSQSVLANGTAANPSYTFDSSVGLGIFKPAADSLGFSTNSTERMRIDSNGNVGIGTASPSQKLTVAGTIESTSGGFKFPDATVQTTAGGVPSGAILYFATSTCPTGWSEVIAARGRYIVGLPASGSVSSTVGTALSNSEDRVVGPHTHTITDNQHSHGLSPQTAAPQGITTSNTGGGLMTAQWGPAGTQSSPTGITINNTGTNISATAGTNAPYIQFLVCKKN